MWQSCSRGFPRARRCFCQPIFLSTPAPSSTSHCDSFEGQIDRITENRLARQILLVGGTGTGVLAGHLTGFGHAEVPSADQTCPARSQYALDLVHLLFRCTPEYRRAAEIHLTKLRTVLAWPPQMGLREIDLGSGAIRMSILSGSPAAGRLGDPGGCGCGVALWKRTGGESRNRYSLSKGFFSHRSR